MGEPLLNTNLPRMIEYLNKNEIADCYEIITIIVNINRFWNGRICR